MIEITESLKVLIVVQREQRDRGMLTPYGEGYLSGLERAYALCTEGGKN